MSFRALDTAAWESLLDSAGVRDLYLRSGWLEASTALEPAGSRPVLLAYEHEGNAVLCPLIIRPIPDTDQFDATTAYGYGGTLRISGQFDPEAVGAALDAWCSESNVVTSFFRAHPLHNTVATTPKRAVVHRGVGTVGWRLGSEALRDGMHKHHRRACNKADREGVVIDIVAVDQTIDLDVFRAMYTITMERQSANSFYFFPDTYWEQLVKAFAGDMYVIQASLAGEPVAALLVLDDGDNLHYHLGASYDAARGVGASNRCFLAAAEMGHALGRSIFHLGGGVGGGEDALLQFKHRYAPDTPLLPFGVAKLVHMPDAYHALAGTDSVDGFFPPWRQQIAEGGA